MPDLTADLPPDLVRASALVLAPAPAPAPAIGQGATSAAARLLGLGPGLTPAGDDVLCGLLLGLRATGRETERARLERAVTRLPGRTTALSATLLRQAAHGYAVPVLVDLLRAWHQDPDAAGLDAAGPDATRPTALARLTAEVAAIGHTSGRALLLGLRIALAPPPGPASPPTRPTTRPKRGPS